MMMLHALDLAWGLLWLGCAVVGHATDIDWYNPPGEKILPGNTNILVSRDDEFTSTLMISRVTQDHAGFFKCVAKASGLEAEARVQLQIYQEITFRHAPSPQEFIEGEDAVVECDVFSSPAPEVAWRKEHKLIKDGTDERIKMLENGHLQINNIQKADGGVYQCRGHITSFGVVSFKMITVVVNYAPKIQDQGPVYTWEGNPANVSCEVEAHPSAEIRWFRDGLQLHNANDNNMKIYDSQTVSYLEVKPESPNDFGSYYCKATNILGTSSKEFLLIEAVVPSSPHIQQVEPLSSTAEVEFSKPISSGGVAILKYKVQWRLPDNEWKSTEYEASDDLTKITLTELAQGTGYEVRISAINGRGAGDSSKPISFKTKTAACDGCFSSLPSSVTANSTVL